MIEKELIDKLYEKIADKTLRFGCKIKHQIHGEGIYIQMNGDRNVG